MSHSANDNAGNPAPLDIALWLDAHMLSCEPSFIRHLAMGLKSEGQKVTFLAPHDLDVSSLPTLGSRVLTYRSSRLNKIPILQRSRMADLMAETAVLPPDVILAWGSADPTAVQLLSSSPSAPSPVPVIVWCWDGGDLHRPLLSLPGVRQVLASSPQVASRAPMILRPPVTVVRPGVYTEEAIACFDVDGQLPCLVCLDPLSDRTQYEPLLLACQRLAADNVEFLFFAYDTGRDDHSIWKMAERLGLLDRISFVPFQQDAEPLLMHGDLYLHVLPSSRVAYRTLEAMGRGLAVVGRPNVAADYLIDGQTARIIPDPTAEAWHGTLADLLTDRAKTVAQARRAQQYVRDHHALSPMLTQLITIVRQTAGTPIPMRGVG